MAATFLSCLPTIVVFPPNTFDKPLNPFNHLGLLVLIFIISPNALPFPPVVCRGLLALLPFLPKSISFMPDAALIAIVAPPAAIAREPNSLPIVEPLIALSSKMFVNPSLIPVHTLVKRFFIPSTNPSFLNPLRISIAKLPAPRAMFSLNLAILSDKPVILDTDLSIPACSSASDFFAFAAFFAAVSPDSAVMVFKASPESLAFMYWSLVNPIDLAKAS